MRRHLPSKLTASQHGMLATSHAIPCRALSHRTRQRGGVGVNDVQREAILGRVVAQLAAVIVQHRQQPPALVLELQNLQADMGVRVGRNDGQWGGMGMAWCGDYSRA